MRKKFTMLLAALFLTMGAAWAQVYQKIPHTKWTVTALNQAGVQGNEGGIDYLKDENPETFYHSDYSNSYSDGNSGKKKGQDGLQAFMVELPEVMPIDKITYKGRSNGPNNWATKARIYVFETLPDGWPKDGEAVKQLSAMTYTEKEGLLKRTDNIVLGTPAFDNNDNGTWAADQNIKTAEFSSTQQGKYILFVADATTGTNGYLCCGDFHLWQKVEGIESDKGYCLKIQDLEGYYLNVKTGNTISKTTEKIAAYLTLNDGYWHISALPGRNNFVGVSQWNATTGQKNPANWNIYKKGDYWILSQANYFGSAGNDYHYLGANGGNISTETYVYTDKPTSEAVKIIFEEVPTVDVTFNYYDGEDKVNTIIETFMKDAAIQIGDVPTMDFYADYAFKSEGDIIATEDADYNISCRADFPFAVSTIDANGKVEGVWYKLTQTGDGANNKIAYTYDGKGNDPHRVNFVADNENAKAYWAFVRVDGTADRFRIYNLGRPGVPMAAVRNAGYQHFNQGQYYIDNRANSVTEFIISKNETGFNIQIPFEYTDNWYAGSGNHIEPKPQFGIWSTQDNASIARGGSRLSVEEVAVSDLDLAKASAKIAWRNVVWGEGFPNFTTTYNETSIASFEALDAVIDAATTVDEVNTIAAELEENASKYRIRMYNAGRYKEKEKKFYVSGSTVKENGDDNSEFWYDKSRNLQQVATELYLVHSTKIADQKDAYSLTSTRSEASVFTFTTTTAVEGAWSVYDGFGYMCDWGNTNKVFSHNNQSDAWATWMVEDVVRETLLATFEELCLAAIGYANGVDLGSYTHKDYNDPKELGAEIERIKSIVDADATIAEIESAIQQIENLIDGFNIELPTKGFYYFVNYDFDDNGEYLSDDRLNDEKTQRVLTTGEPTAKNIFYYDGQALMGYVSGFGFEYGVCNTQTPEKMNHFEFGMAYDFGMYTVKSSLGTSNKEDKYSNRYWKNKGNNELDYVEAKDAADASGWELIKVEYLPVTVGDRLHATFFAPVAVTIPEGIQAYTGEVNGEWLTLTEVEGTIPAGTAVVLIAQEAKTYEFKIVENAAAAVVSDLRGTAPTIVNDKKDAADKYYTLQPHGENGVAFRPYTGANFGGFKAYLKMPDGANAAALRIRFAGEEDATGIEGIELGEELVIYDLAGRRVQKMEKGIYIVNGKKVVIK